MSNYDQMVADFNSASGASYSASVHLLNFRRTRRGILVGWYAAKPHEVVELLHYVCNAGRPYYAKFDGRIVEREALP